MAIGTVTPNLQQVGLGSNAWGNTMNINAIKTAMMLQTGVKSRVATLPGSPAHADRYLLTTSNRICMWIAAFNDGVTLEPAQWVQMSPAVGMLLFVEDEEKLYVWRDEGLWQEALDLNETHHAVEREFALYAPGIMRPNNTVFQYIAGMELTIPAGAPGSHALLDKGPVGGSLQFTIRHNGAQVGTVTFGSGATVGSVSFPAERIIYDAYVENTLVQAHTLLVTSPNDLRAAEGLSLTLRGKIRAID